jgi:DNA polymerase IV
MDRIILHVDMDAFFAAIEQLDHPEFRGRPVVVGADPQGGKGRGVVSTCSYEARAFGIHSAMPVSKAYKLCPHAVYTFPRGKRYLQVSKKIMAVLEEFSPDVEPLSIDEAFLDISTSYKIFGSVKDAGLAVKRRIKEETSLNASVGIAPSKFIAKIASDLEKPDGIVIVDQGNEKQFLAPLHISRMWGVGKKTLPIMQNLGINTIGDLARYSQKDIIERLGKSGLHFWNLANAIDERNIERHVKAKSISKETTFYHDKANPDELRETLLYLCNELTREMRRKKYFGRTVTLKIRLEDFSTFTRSRTLSEMVNSCEQIQKHIEDMFVSFNRENKRVRLLGVAVSHLQHESGQINLFEKESENARKIDRLIDQVREKFGEKSITRASLVRTEYDSQWIRD